MSGYVAGVIGGIVGGLAIAALGMAYGAVSGRGLWSLPNRIGGIILGPRRADVRLFGVATLVGVALHIGLSALFGIVIALLAQDFTHAYLATGLVVGAALWLINYVGIGAIHPGAREVREVESCPDRARSSPTIRVHYWRCRLLNPAIVRFSHHDKAATTNRLPPNERPQHRTGA